MRDSCLNILPRHGVKEVAAIMLTHGHADAILGVYVRVRVGVRVRVRVGLGFISI
jgi:phosphoribosyl 1,2-cyclic phosphodiesterase